MGHENDDPKETGETEPAQHDSGSDERRREDDIDATLAHEGPPLSKTIAFGSTGDDTVAASGPPRAGTVFGNYELLELIGRGGMGVVYRARQINLNRIVAVKMIRSQVLATDEDIQRFYIEAQAAGGLGHPNIVTVYEMGEYDGQQFFSMDYVEGTDLARLSKDERLPRGQIAKYVKHIAAAVHYAHERGILHRDLKPANILIDTRDRPHITDFGLAKHVDDDSHMTREGAVLGTPSYMSPEQAAGRHQDVDKSTDIYALGAILYELLTGRPPFRGDSVIETLMEVVHREPARPRDIDPDVDRDLEAICLKCVEKDPRRRYATAGELADDLDRLLRGVPIRARPPSTRERVVRWVRGIPVVAAVTGQRVASPTAWQRRANWMVIGLPLLALAGAALWHWLPDTLPRKIRIASGTPGGMYAAVADRYRQPLSDTARRTVEVLATQGSIENRELLLSGKADLAIMQAGAVSADDVAAIAPLYYEVVHVIVRADLSDVRSIRDLRDKNVSLGPEGSGMRTGAEELLSYYGVPLSTIRRSGHPFTQLDDDLTLDAAIVTTGLDNADLKRLLGAGRLKLIAADDGEISLHRPSFKPFKIRPAHYDVAAEMPEEGVPTVATTALLAVRKNEGDVLVTTALRALYENALLKDIPGSIRRDEAALWQTLPWHPAAREYFETK